MLAWESLVEAQALRRQGWSVSAIARHLGVTRLTVRRYLNGERVPGQRARTVVDPFDEFGEYCRLRLAGDPHVWATTLFDEVVELGYAGSYQSFTRAIRTRGLRPRCEACMAAKSKDRAVIEHPPGEETQWDWLELPNPPTPWGLSGDAHLLLGVLAHSGRWRGSLAEAEDQPHLIEGLYQVATRLGGLTRRWRFDRMATVCHPGSGRITASFAPVAVHYQVGISICPARHAWRKGVVEKSAHTIAQRWWRTVGDDVTVAAAQASLDRLCVKLDARKRSATACTRRSASSPTQSHCGRCPHRSRRSSRSSGWSATKPWCRFAATSTRCHLVTLARWWRCGTGSASPRWTSAPAAAHC
jgi:transposase